jgi:hypothetical protein
MAKERHQASIRETAFECPHCGAFTTQYWFRTHVCPLEDKMPLPSIPNEKWLKEVQADVKMSEDVKKELGSWYSRVATGHVSLVDAPDSAWGYRAYNLHISRCYNCKKIAVWVHDTMVFPNEKQGPLPNQDLPADVAKDFEEARSIVGLSPRGSAALLRLCVQKLCVCLGQKDKNLDDAIAALVKQGLNHRVQQSLVVHDSCTCG